jgi:hypothetical protein
VHVTVSAATDQAAIQKSGKARDRLIDFEPRFNLWSVL